MDLIKNSRQTRILLGERRVPCFQRVVARCLDSLVVAILFFIGREIWSPMGWLAAIGYAATQDSFGKGQSLGKKIMGLQVVEEHSGLSCSVSHSVLRNMPWLMSLLCLPIPVVGILMHLVLIPVMALEFYLLFSLDSGVRLGDVMANTLVVECFDEVVETAQ
jgi:uncharacterized RDD family membrane protein YckC